MPAELEKLTLYNSGMTRLAEFLNGYPEIQRRGFSNPTCSMLEGGYKAMFKNGRLVRETGEMRRDNSLIGKLYKGSGNEIFYLREWMEEDTPEGPFFVLVKNPLNLTIPNIGLRNALVLAEGHLFAGVLYRGIRIRRPVVPHEQDTLQREFNKLLKEVNQEVIQRPPFNEEY